MHNLINLNLPLKDEKKRKIGNGLKYHPTDEKSNPTKVTPIFFMSN